jgi:hypothetical protein
MFNVQENLPGKLCWFAVVTSLLIVYGIDRRRNE